MAQSVPETAIDLYRQALALHAAGDIEGALSKAQEALAIDPHYADARAYVGSTLVQKQARYAEGLAVLSRALEDAPHDPALLYTLGWCAEFVAHRITRRPMPGLDPSELYTKAEQYLRRCLELKPQGKLRDDAADLLSSIIREDVE